MRLKSFLTLILLFCACPVYAQFRAGIEGTVTDSTGAVVKGAKISVTSQETGASQGSDLERQWLLQCAASGAGAIYGQCHVDRF
jgi:hypothetical protein